MRDMNYDDYEYKMGEVIMNYYYKKKKNKKVLSCVLSLPSFAKECQLNVGRIFQCSKMAK